MMAAKPGRPFLNLFVYKMPNPSFQLGIFLLIGGLGEHASF